MAEWDLITERPPHAVYTKNRTAARPAPRKRAQGIPEKGVFMGILSHLFCIDINRGVRNYQATPGAVLLDVRSRESYARKRIPESRNLPLEELSRAKEVLPDLSVPLFVYAYGGETSARAVSRLKDMGYTQVHDIGGLKKCCGSHGYYGPTEGTRWFSSP